MKSSIHFMLVPDRFSSRLVKRSLAQSNSWLNVQVGTWIELLELARSSYCVSPSSDDWGELLGKISAQKDVFWHQSAQVAEQECIDIIAGTLNKFIQAQFFKPHEPIDAGTLQGLSSRCNQHIIDLERFWNETGCPLPPELSQINSIVGVPDSHSIRALVVYRIPGYPELSPFQRRLLQKLAMDAEGYERKPQLQETLQNCLTESPLSPEGSTLRMIQENLFVENTDKSELDNTVQWISCRDYQEEVEIAISMIQKQVSEDGYQPSDFGILIPQDQNYISALRNTSDFTNVLLSNLDREMLHKNLVAECLRLYVITRRRPAPVLALASLLSSPLMPWNQAEGMALAQQVIDGDYRFHAPPSSGEAGKRILSLIRTDPHTSLSLKKGAQEFIKCMEKNKTSESDDHFAEIKLALSGVLHSTTTIETNELLSLIAQSSHAVIDDHVDPKDGVAVLQEHGEPWRDVKQLFVLGFTDGHYPLNSTASPVFSGNDLDNIEEQFDIDIGGPSRTIDSNRKRFKRQIMAVSERVSFISPKYDSPGNELDVSTSMVFMLPMLKGVDDIGQVQRSIDLPEDRALIMGHPPEVSLQAIPPRSVISSDLELERNLTEINTYDDGSIRPQSPSSLGTLLGSPLAWLFDRTSITAREWEPETLGVMTKGTLAHEVMELLFAPDLPLPKAEEIEFRVPDLLGNCILKISPFLLGKEWHVERHNLEREIVIAAKAWLVILQELQATPVAAETWLHGTIEDIPIRGKADLVMRLSSGHFLVVDYKKSSSPARRKQMENGFDSQADLYRRMILANGISGIASNVTGENIGSMYFLMNDQVALSDNLGPKQTLPGGVEEISTDIAVNAIQLIKERIEDLKNGRIRLNRTTDEDWFKKSAGIKLYSLENSPLFRLFLIDEVEI